MIQLHRLEGFYRVALAEGYARAARQFPYPITQPAVHQQVRKLEKELDVRLFQRVSKDRVALTAAGRYLFDFCAPFFERLPGIVRSVASLSFGGELRIDASGLALRQLMPRWLKALRQQEPDITVALQEIERPDINRLRRSDADLIVDYIPQLPPGIASRVLAHCQVFLVLPVEKARGRTRVSVTQLGSEPFVAYHPDLPHHALQLAELQRHGVKPERLLSASSAESILGFVAAGLGYSLVPWIGAGGPVVEGVRALPYGGADTRIPIVAAWREDGPVNPLIRKALAAHGAEIEGNVADASKPAAPSKKSRGQKKDRR